MNLDFLFTQQLSLTIIAQFFQFWPLKYAVQIREKILQFQFFDKKKMKIQILFIFMTISCFKLSTIRFAVFLVFASNVLYNAKWTFIVFDFSLCRSFLKLKLSAPHKQFPVDLTIFHYLGLLALFLYDFVLLLIKDGCLTNIYI